MNKIKNLFSECQINGIQLQQLDGTVIRIRYPEGVLIDDLVEKLKTHKTELIKELQVRENAGGWTTRNPRPPKPAATGNCICGSTQWRNTDIHQGKSIRRDCAVCGKFLDFPVWYGVQ